MPLFEFKKLITESNHESKARNSFGATAHQSIKPVPFALVGRGIPLIGISHKLYNKWGSK